jgi:uncharacterized protein with von Willebrand factor type A (vWA) domain
MAKKKTTTTVTTTVTEEIVPDTKKLKAFILLDRSGSMASCHKQTVDGVNEYINGLRAAKDKDIRVTLALFDHQYNGLDLSFVRENIPISEIKDIKYEEFVPRGGTPLYDAVGTLEQKIGNAASDEQIALVIATDGEENSSRNFTSEQIKTTLTRRQNQDNWLVLYMGANQNAWLESQKFGIRSGMTMNYATLCSAGAFEGMAASTMRYAGSNSLASAELTDDERMKAKGE